MAYSKVDELPAEIKDQLPNHAQQMFMAAFNSAQSDGMDEESAKRVAWNSVKEKYKQGADGQWQFNDRGGGTDDKPTVAGGN